MLGEAMSGERPMAGGKEVRACREAEAGAGARELALGFFILCRSSVPAERGLRKLMNPLLLHTLPRCHLESDALQRLLGNGPGNSCPCPYFSMRVTICL
jgi:hypothetical protein